jgi:hypothetical protein
MYGGLVTNLIYASAELRISSSLGDAGSYTYLGGNPRSHANANWPLSG